MTAVEPSADGLGCLYGGCGTLLLTPLAVGLGAFVAPLMVAPPLLWATQWLWVLPALVLVRRRSARVGILTVAAGIATLSLGLFATMGLPLA